MGMFDWLNCDYPLPNGKAHVQPGQCDAGAYQTKDLGNGLDVYRISKDGRLFLEKYGEWTGNDRTGQFIPYTG